MYKELFILIAIIVIITVLDVVTQKYTANSIQEMSTKLSNLKEEIKSNSTNTDFIKQQNSNIYDNWMLHHDILSFYIDHSELEKVETSFSSCKSLIESQQYDFALAELEKAIFLLKHIGDKYAFNFANIF